MTGSKKADDVLTIPIMLCITGYHGDYADDDDDDDVDGRGF